ncbi:MAG: tetratricopeptide repeat protein, partial [Betaproteobacteria bacterium]
MLAKLIKQLRNAWVKPANAKALAVLLNEAIACQGRGEWLAAEDLLRRALSQHPRDPNAIHLLANNLMTQRRHAEAKTLLEKVIGTQPENVQAHYHLASTLEALDELEAARQCLMRSLAMQPDSFATMNNLGNVLSKLRRLDEADDWYARALKLAPDFAAVVFNTGQLRRTMGRVPEAIALYQRALELDPSLVGAHSNYIYWLNFLPEYTPLQVFDAHREWARRHAEPLLAGVAMPTNDASPERRLRIGYVSPNFKNHAAAYFFESTLISHDTSAFEIFCYSDVTDADECTARLKAYG